MARALGAVSRGAFLRRARGAFRTRMGSSSRPNCAPALGAGARPCPLQAAESRPSLASAHALRRGGTLREQLPIPLPDRIVPILLPPRLLRRLLRRQLQLEDLETFALGVFLGRAKPVVIVDP